MPPAGSPGSPANDTAGVLLARLAAALNGCADAGLLTDLRHGAVLTPLGYVLPGTDGRWVVRMLTS